MATRSEPPSPQSDDALNRLLRPELNKAGDDLRLAEDPLLNTRPDATVSNGALSGYEFDLACPLCGTRQVARESQVGARIACPDCHTEFDVRTPPVGARRAATVQSSDDLVLAAPVDKAPFQELANDLLSDAAADLDERHGVPSGTSTADEALSAAETALNERWEPPDLPDRPFRTGILRFLKHPAAWLPLILLGLGLLVEFAAVEAAIQTGANDNPITQVASVGLRVFAGFFGLAVASTMAACVIAITQDTSNGMDTIEGWPGIAFLEWIGDSVYVLNALFLAVVPGFVLATAADSLGAPGLYWQIVGVFSLLGIVLIFPYILLSMLESSSLMGLVSRPLLRSLRIGSRYWLNYVLTSAPLVICVGALAFTRFKWSNSPVAVDAVLCFLIVLCVMLYSRLLGRLAWSCDEAIFAADNAEEAASEDDSEGGPTPAEAGS